MNDRFLQRQQSRDDDYYSESVKKIKDNPALSRAISKKRDSSSESGYYSSGSEYSGKGNGVDGKNIPSYMGGNPQVAPQSRAKEGFFSRKKSIPDLGTGGMDWWKKSAVRENLPIFNNDDYSDSNEESFPVDDFDPVSLRKVRKKEKGKGPNFKVVDKKAPLIWTTGFVVMSVLVTGLSIYYGGALKMTVNPFYGPDAFKLMEFGAKFGPLLSDGELWRFGTAMVLHPGAIHLVACSVIIFSLYNIERTKGFWTSMLPFVLAGTYGYILSAMFLPLTVQCGSNGGVAGWLGWKLIEIISKWGTKKKVCRLVTVIIELVFIIVMGMLPYNDNFCNAGGLIMGVLVGLTMMPNTAVTECQTAARMIFALLAFPIMATLFCLCLVLYLRRVNTHSWCSWCMKVSCINFSFANWCPTE